MDERSADAPINGREECPGCGRPLTLVVRGGMAVASGHVLLTDTCKVQPWGSRSKCGQHYGILILPGPANGDRPVPVQRHYIFGGSFHEIVNRAHHAINRLKGTERFVAVAGS